MGKWVTIGANRSVKFCRRAHRAGHAHALASASAALLFLSLAIGAPNIEAQLSRLSIGGFAQLGERAVMGS